MQQMADKMSAMQAQREWVDKSRLEPLNLPHDDMSFYSLDRDSMVDTLKMLKEEGYTMPENLIETIQGETDEEEE